MQAHYGPSWPGSPESGMALGPLPVWKPRACPSPRRRASADGGERTGFDGSLRQVEPDGTVITFYRGGLRCPRRRGLSTVRPGRVPLSRLF